LQLLTTVAPLAAPAATLDTGANAIPAGLTHLLVIVHGRSATAAIGDTAAAQFNGDTGANYTWMTLQGNGGAATSGSGSGTVARVAFCAAASQPAGQFSGTGILISRYSSNDAIKQGVSFSTGATSASPWLLGMLNFSWASSAAINRIALSFITGANFTAGSGLWVYGL
jgi:hypothetical protein